MTLQQRSCVLTYICLSTASPFFEMNFELRWAWLHVYHVIASCVSFLAFFESILDVLLNFSFLILNKVLFAVLVSRVITILSPRL